jgi:uncharacterized protein (TIGR00251 family)
VKKAPEPGARGLDLREKNGSVTLRVRVTPRAPRDGLGGVRDGALLVRLTAPPVEGAANLALARFLGKTLGLAPSFVSVAAGQASRHKLVRITGVGADQVRARLEGGLPIEAAEPVRP